MKPQITANHLSRYYSPNSPSLFGLRSSPYSEPVKALDDVSFSIMEGEKIALIGSNGAGKSTLIKLLCGIVSPSKGELHVLGRTPHKERHSHVQNLGVVFGQRTQLAWDIPPRETFRLLCALHRIPENEYAQRLDHFTHIFEAESLIDTPTRKLSLGQRMRCDLIASLLHNPAIILLDEPSIGLDFQAKQKLHSLLSSYTKKSNATLIISSHDIEDIQICDRVLILNNGRLILDEPIEDLQSRYTKGIRFKAKPNFISPPADIRSEGDFYFCQDWPSLLKLQQQYPEHHFEDAVEIEFRFRQILQQLST